VETPVRAIHVHAAHRDETLRDAAHRVGDRACLRLGHRVHIDDDVRSELGDRIAMVADRITVAVDMTDVRREIDLVLAAVEDRDGMPCLCQLAHHRRSDEDRPADDEDAAHVSATARFSTPLRPPVTAGPLVTP
jgi:hypothetical protein